MHTTNQLTHDATSEAQAGELARVEGDFNQAMISNDVAQIRACISDDWVLVTPEAGVGRGARILHVSALGALTHDPMTKDVARVSGDGDVVVVTGRGRNTGSYKGQPISADEWVTDVYRKIDGRWLCALTHLTPVAR